MAGVAGVTPSRNTIAASVCLEYTSCIDASLVKHELVTGSTVVSGSEEDPKWYVLLWGEIVRTLSKKAPLFDAPDGGAPEEETISVDE